MHRNVVKVLDLGGDEDGGDGQIYLVMELLKGQSLAARLRASRELLPLAEVAALFADILDGVGAAHASGIVHRDLKPENVLLAGQDGERVAKVVDFGLAHIDDPLDAGPTLTSKDMVAGTPEYMSPEAIAPVEVRHHDGALHGLVRDHDERPVKEHRDEQRLHHMADPPVHRALRRRSRGRRRGPGERATRADERVEARHPCVQRAPACGHEARIRLDAPPREVQEHAAAREVTRGDAEREAGARVGLRCEEVRRDVGEARSRSRSAAMTARSSRPTAEKSARAS
ncbi:protein kinase domain-containing protein [Sorangium sp. So ce128]|uniref:protein kinase domain-containing protein n=1 Tax=Sorangium sp. So ce128 TaxID=3133281 RepID=UPI003F5F0E56